MNRFAIVWVALVALAGCQGASPTGGARDEGGAVRVKTTRPAPAAVVRQTEQPATVEAYERTAIHARVPGYVGEVLVDVGDRLEADQVLARLYVPELDEELKQKAALVEQAKAAVEAAEAAAVTAAARVEEAKAERGRAAADRERWDSEYKRIEGLVAR